VNGDLGWGRTGGNKGSGGSQRSVGPLCTAYGVGVHVAYGSGEDCVGKASGGGSRGLR
jgi:hypothetical protein